MTSAFDLSRTYMHLGLGATVEPLVDFQWDPEYLARYEADHAGDGDDGRLVVVSPHADDWTIWERHPAGDELVVVLSGRVTLIQDDGGGPSSAPRRIELRAGQAGINPRGVWHTADVHEPGQTLFITPGRGTEHRPR